MFAANFEEYLKIVDEAGLYDTSGAETVQLASYNAAQVW